MEERLTLLQTADTFSKKITWSWLCMWIETILFCQVATLFGFGDAGSMVYLSEDVLQIGKIICSFYFSTKCIENVAKGIEAYRIAAGEQESINFDADVDDCIEEYLIGEEEI